jgi:tRNA 2-selenouridine synthase
MTINSPQTITQLWTCGDPCPFDEIIDVRSPAEFADDHMPGAISLPVLSNEERAEVGRVYHQVGAFEARKIGAAIITQNIARHIREHFTAFGKSYHPLLYCWRGGLRSTSLATVMAQIGWRTSILKGGYKTYRHHVLAEWQTVPSRYTFQIIAGATGTGKSKYLRQLASAGHQILDLERLACHRGSLLGFEGDQPPQRLFESQLLEALARLEPGRPVWVEAESRRIGNRFLPATLWQRLHESDGIILRMPLTVRVANLIADYPHMIRQPEILTRQLEKLASRRDDTLIAEWKRLITSGNWPALVESLLIHHYDVGYGRSLRKHFPNVTKEITLTDHDPRWIDWKITDSAS